MIISGAIMAGQLILGLSILVGLHEFGHLIAAKIFGMRVEKFAIGFPPKMWSFQWGETEYAFQLIPLGGYVKISGMVDESMDTDFVATEPEPWEFRSKPAWQRLIVMLGGIIMNVIVGIVIFTFINFSVGTRYLPIEEANKGGFFPNELGEKLGFQYGDKIIAMNGEKIERASQVMNPNFLLESGSYYTVLRNGKEFKIEITTEFIQEFSSNERQAFFISPLSEFDITFIAPNMGADKGGLKAQDKIISIAGQPIKYFQDVALVVKGHKGETIPFVIERNSEQKTLQIAFILLYVTVLQFFRNPKRSTTLNDNHIIAPVDGKVVVIEEVEEPEFFKDKRLQVSIFMSPINVHVTRYALSGIVKYSKYHPGKYLVAWHPKASTENERTTIVVENDAFGPVLYRQIAGALAKRIVNYAKEGQEVTQGTDAGFIKFGSRVDLYLPLNTKLNVKIGDKVKGGTQIVASK